MLQRALLACAAAIQLTCLTRKDSAQRIEMEKAMAATLLALYNEPADSEKFDAYDFSTHAPLARKIPGLVSFTTSRNAVTVAGTGYYMIAILKFASVADIRKGLASREGEATAADLANFAQAGVTLMTFEDREV
jgi:uncharacterized protein (TIGR02118 family)